MPAVTLVRVVLYTQVLISGLKQGTHVFLLPFKSSANIVIGGGSCQGEYPCMEVYGAY
jgi:hypothetical protein